MNIEQMQSAFEQSEYYFFGESQVERVANWAVWKAAWQAALAAQVQQEPLDVELEVKREHSRSTGDAFIHVPVQVQQEADSQWISVDERLPNVAKNDYDYFLVALTIHETGKRVAFEAAYLNELMLQNNDDNLEEDESPFSGWYIEIERDGDTLYQHITHGTVTEWMHKPLPPAPEGEKE